MHPWGQGVRVLVVGPSLSRLHCAGASTTEQYVSLCETLQCKPNSQLLQTFRGCQSPSDVQALSLASNYVGQKGFLALLGMVCHCDGLESLDLTHCELQSPEVTALCRVLKRFATALRTGTGCVCYALRRAVCAMH